MVTTSKKPSRSQANNGQRCLLDRCYIHINQDNLQERNTLSLAQPIIRMVYPQSEMPRSHKSSPSCRGWGSLSASYTSPFQIVTHNAKTTGTKSMGSVITLKIFRTEKSIAALHDLSCIINPSCFSLPYNFSLSCLEISPNNHSLRRSTSSIHARLNNDPNP